ncbi:MAG: acyl-CoA desaturase [Chloroflexota bacterium]
MKPSSPLPEKPLSEKIFIMLGVVVPFVATLYAIVLLWEHYISGLDLALLVTLYFLSGLGVTIGLHRMLTHRSFETYPLVKAIILICASMAGQSSPIYWASAHIQHHAHSDEEGDPHSPLVSLWHAHIGWFFEHVAQYDVYGKWLWQDPVVVWIDRTWVFWMAFGLLMPFAIGGWSGLLWGGLVRMFLVHHVTWSVNSLCHTFGARPFDTRDASRNNWLVALLSGGEGWHNNHHAFPRSANHGLRWWEVDLSAYVIRVLEIVGLVWNVQRVRVQDELKRRNASL